MNVNCKSEVTSMIIVLNIRLEVYL